jgi:hypothetical protein
MKSAAGHSTMADAPASAFDIIQRPSGSPRASRAGYNQTNEGNRQ